MLTKLNFVLPAVILILIGSYLRAILKHLAQAKQSGLPYLIVPFSPLSRLWILSQPILLPILDRLPSWWTQPWLSILVIQRAWHHGYKPFRDMNADTYMLVSPSGNILVTCDPDTTHSILRDSAFGKPVELLALLNIFGPTITAADTPEARLYKSIAAPFFNEKTMKKVWSHSITGAEVLMKALHEDTEELRPNLARLALHLLNVVCFEDSQNCLNELQDRRHLSSGHHLSYSQAMAQVLEYFPTLSITPAIILNYSPLPLHRQAFRAYNVLRRRIQDLHEKKKKEIQDETVPKATSLLDLIVHAGEDSCKGSASLDLPAVQGNIFIFMFAGHEANANTLNFIILLLACHPDIQQSLQADIDRITGLSGPTDWSLEIHYPALSTSYVGAVIHEASRLFTVLPFLPKLSPESPYTLNVANGKYLIPAKTLILINTGAVHRHPTTWPTTCNNGTRGVFSTPKPVHSFNPGHWLHQHADGESGVAQDHFLRPKPGSFVPFSDGSRGCLGKRFALVELVAIVTRIFKSYSAELVVDCDEDASLEERRARWQDAKEAAADQLFKGVEFKMSLRMVGKVRIKFVERGA